VSEDGLHVHAPHDHEVEHRAEHGDNFASRIAVATAILATVGAMFSFQGGTAQNDALIYKNEQAIRKTEASDQWGYYQAKGNKQNLAELGASLAQGDVAQRYQQQVEQYKQDKEAIKAKAEALEQQAAVAEQQSEHALHRHHRWAMSITTIQIAISLAAITLLTRKKWLGFGVAAFSLASVILAAMALAGV
jgi:hypothetical protein